VGTTVAFKGLRFRDGKIKVGAAQETAARMEVYVDQVREQQSEVAVEGSCASEETITCHTTNYEQFACVVETRINIGRAG